MSYLQRALTVPEDSTIRQAVDILKVTNLILKFQEISYLMYSEVIITFLLQSIDAFDISRSFEQLTELGKIMLQLPLEPQYAKMVLFGVALKCLDPILTVAAFSKHKFVNFLYQHYEKKDRKISKISHCTG